MLLALFELLLLQLLLLVLLLLLLLLECDLDLIASSSLRALSFCWLGRMDVGVLGTLDGVVGAEIGGGGGGGCDGNGYCKPLTGCIDDKLFDSRWANTFVVGNGLLYGDCICGLFNGDALIRELVLNCDVYDGVDSMRVN